jgi:hypothetical protein
VDLRCAGCIHAPYNEIEITLLDKRGDRLSEIPPQNLSVIDDMRGGLRPHAVLPGTNMKDHVDDCLMVEAIISSYDAVSDTLFPMGIGMISG